jgi:hypothetical protein
MEFKCPAFHCCPGVVDHRPEKLSRGAEFLASLKNIDPSPLNQKAKVSLFQVQKAKIDPAKLKSPVSYVIVNTEHHTLRIPV